MTDQRLEIPPQQILCPTDFTEHSEYALTVAEKMARFCDAELILVHVVEYPPVVVSPDSEAVGSEPSLYEQKLVDEAEEKLEELSQLISPGVVHREVVLRGNAVDALVEYSEEEDVDMLVLVTHQESRWKRAIFGSVVEPVMRGTACPVLVVTSPG